MDFSLNLNGDKRLIKKLDNISDSIKDFKKPLKETGNLIVEEVDKQFETEGSRLNKKWKALKSATEAQKRRAGYGSKGILERTGALRKSFKAAVDRFKVTVSSKSSYYKYHQRGDRPQPKRTMLTLSERLKQDIVEIFHKYIRKVINE